MTGPAPVQAAQARVRARPGQAARSRRVIRFAGPVFTAWLASASGCGGATAAPAREPFAAPSAADTRTPIERRRDAACDQLAPKITVCAVEDARADFAAGKTDRRQLDLDTAPDVQRKHTEEFAHACKAAQYTSRQVRVLEVCFREERGCPGLLDCLGHLQDAEPRQR